MKQVIILALLLALSCAATLLYSTGTAGSKLGTVTFGAEDYSDNATFNVGDDRTFTFYFKLGQLANSSVVADDFGYLFWLENQAGSGIYIAHEYPVEDENYLFILTDGPYVLAGSEAEEDASTELTGTEAVDYWYQVFIVYDGTTGVIKYAFNSSTLSTLTDNTEIIMAYADAGATTEAYDLVGFLDDSEDTEETLTDITVSFDDFRVYEGALTGDELITEVKCTEAQYTAGVYYGQNCAYQPPADNDDDSGVLIQISLLVLMIALIFLY